VLLAGRGYGKTRTAVEWVRERIESGARRLLLAGPTTQDVRDVMIEGESGILAKSPPWMRPHYEPSKRRLTWPSGARAVLLSADEPERFRGLQSDSFWADELASWRYPDAWDQMQLGCRLGSKYGVTPRGIISTTPKPTPLIKQLVADARSVVTRGSTYENAANLAPAFISTIISRYEGTRIGRQELYAEILDEVEGALWSRAVIEQSRATRLPDAFLRVVVAVDPAVTATETSDETGIIVAGIGSDRHLYVLADLSGRMTPNEWARKAIGALDTWNADRVVAEENQGGKLVEHALRTVRRDVPYTGVRATQGKRTRAEPVAAMYEQKKVHHVGGFPKLEDQLCEWEPLSGDRSPDRLDALVWALSALAFTNTSRRGFGPLNDSALDPDYDP